MTLYSLHLLQPHHIWGPLEEDACVRIQFTDSSLACNIIMLQYVPGKLSSLDINTSHCNWVMNFPDWEASGKLDWHWPSQRAQDPYELLTHFSDSSLYFPSKPLSQVADNTVVWVSSATMSHQTKRCNFFGEQVWKQKTVFVYSQNKRIVILLRLSPTTYLPSVYFKFLSTISLDKKEGLHCSLRRANFALSSPPIDIKD